MRDTLQRFTVVYARFALGAGFLSAVADRFGLWGPPGARHVAWGDFQHFLGYTATLNPSLPARVIPAVGVAATVCEIVLGIALIVGISTPLVAALSGCLLLAFAAGMTVGPGVKTALDASVFAASAAAFLLAFLARPQSTVSAPPEREGKPRGNQRGGRRR
jgi:uncharacterized membrane protein YphA (DoxX/SURF4 family)